MKIAIASDHGGIELKSVLINHLQERLIVVHTQRNPVTIRIMQKKHAGKYSREMLI